MTSIALAFATFILHLCTAWRYGYFRDELYFIACGRHLAWGYVDQPPLVALVAWLAQPANDGLIALRFLPCLAAGLTTYVAIQIARDLGGGRFAQWLAGIAVALTPAYLLLGNILTTTSFEPLSWTLLIWLVIPSVAKHSRGTDSKTWLALAAAASFGLYGKYSMALLLVALLIGLLVTKERRTLATAWFPIAAAIVAIVTLPNLFWQAAHGWPFFAVLQGDAAHRHAFNNGWLLESQNLAGNALSFATEQLVYTNPLAAPVWLAGLIAPFTWTRMRELRFISVAYIVLFVAAVTLEAKGYYIIGVYGTLLAIGAVVFERASFWLRSALFVAPDRDGCCNDAAFDSGSVNRRIHRLFARARTHWAQRARSSHSTGLCRRVRLGTARARRRLRVRHVAGRDTRRNARSTPTPTPTRAQSISSVQPPAFRAQSAAKIRIGSGERMATTERA